MPLDARGASILLGRPLLDQTGRILDLECLRPLLERVIAEWDAEQIWLFGSRARGDARPASDWDLLVVVPDDLDESQFDPLVAWRLRREADMKAHLILCTVSDFTEDRTTPNTIAYEASANGVLLHER